MSAGGYPTEVSGSQGQVAEVRRADSTAEHYASRDEVIRLREESPPDARLPSDLAWISDATTDDLDDTVAGHRQITSDLDAGPPAQAQQPRNRT